jgi:hypothetical protein
LIARALSNFIGLFGPLEGRDIIVAYWETKVKRTTKGRQKERGAWVRNVSMVNSVHVGWRKRWRYGGNR